MGKQQASKRARRALKQARFAGLPRNTAHPSHQAGWGRWQRTWRDRNDL